TARLGTPPPGTTGAANDWLTGREPWEARVGGDIVLPCSYDEAAARSLRRREALAAWNGSFARDSFAWVTPPVLNRYTRVATEMCPATGTLRALGYGLAGGAAGAEAVTQPRELAIAGRP